MVKILNQNIVLMKSAFVSLLILLVAISASASSCDSGFSYVEFTRTEGNAVCQVRLSDESLITDGLVLIDKFGATTKAYCLNAGYYTVYCNGPASVTVTNYDDPFVFKAAGNVFFELTQSEVSWTTLPSGHHESDFDKSKPITGKDAYPADPTTKGSDFTCDEAGYRSYLGKWDAEKKYTALSGDEFTKRLEYFIDSCEKIHDWNMRNKYRMEFTFYADWHPTEFEEITTTKQRYSGIQTLTSMISVPFNNSIYRYLMPSVDPCDESADLREYIYKPQPCAVTWAFAVTNSIEYAIKKLYLEEYDQIVEVALSAQELIDCVGEEHGVEGKVCDGLPLAWAFDYIFENGIAYSQFYPHTNKKGECQPVDDEHKYHIAGYEKPSTYNKLGLFELVARGPTAVTLGLDPEFFQYYRNDREEGPYFDTAYWRPSVYGVVVEFKQYAVEGQPEYAEWPFFAVESRLRACDSFVFRLPIRDSAIDANIAGIAGFAIRPIVMELLPTPEPPTIPATPTPSGTPTPSATPTPTPTPTPEPWFAIYDPFILGDNCEIESASTCYNDVLKDDNVTRMYLKVRDAYPTKALAHTRVLALAGMTQLSLDLWHESLSKQTLNEAPIDMYLYGDVLLSRMLDAPLIPRLMELTKYTRPSRLFFVYGTFKREGFNETLDWMVKNADKGYFRHLKVFHVNEMNIQSCVTLENADALQTDIISNLKKICEDEDNFPELEEMNFDNNGYNEGGPYYQQSQFADALEKACQQTSRKIAISAWTDLSVVYPMMCGSPDESYGYYNLEDKDEIAQCRFTWHWELKTGYRMYGDKGPFPSRENPRCETTEAPTEAPATDAPTDNPVTDAPTDAPENP